MNGMIGKRLLWKWYKVEVRTLLSPAYSCKEAWEGRHQNEVLRGKDSYELMGEVQRKLLGSGMATAVDLDIMMNKLQYGDQLTEVKDILYKVRHSPEGTRVLDSTHHALARLCLSTKLPDIMLDFLSDTINYGIFPDVFASNLLMDHFIEQNQFRNAARVAAYVMQQEMFENETGAWLSVYSCVKWVEAGGEAAEPWKTSKDSQDPQESQQQAEDDDEEIVFKVPWLKNPHNDNHFDLTHPMKIVGKTLAWMGRALPPQSLSSTNAQVLGYLLMGETEEVSPLLHTHKDGLLGDTLELYRKAQESTSGEEKSGESSAQLAELDKVAMKKGRLAERVLEDFLSRQEELEEGDTVEMKDLFQSWNSLRQRLIKAQVERFLKRERLKEIHKEIQELEEREDLLTFFENKEKWEKMIRPELLERKMEKKDSLHELPTDEEYAKNIFAAVKQKQQSRKLTLFETNK